MIYIMRGGLKTSMRQNNIEERPFEVGLEAEAVFLEGEEVPQIPSKGNKHKHGGRKGVAFLENWEQN